MKGRTKKTVGKGRIEALFKGLSEKGRKALITFVTAGDPDLDTTAALILEMERSGADLIELGIPFSDPMADGPTIQASSERALERGATLGRIMELVADVRAKSEIPVVLFGYYNPIFCYGLRRFARAAARAGADGVLVVDLPPEESAELKAELDAVGVDLIYLLTPTSDSSRMKLVASRATGFIYFISVTGVTGARSAFSSKVHGYVKALRRCTSLPVGVGFGISSPAQAKEAARFSDAVVVGSAIVGRIAAAKGKTAMLKEVGAFVRGIKRAMKKS